ncbi:ABC transporter substrate-binding protein [Kocuria flava]|uniref:Glycine/betaine ABC transporter substrate-binding protein n=1 Tax=Kocuria flava TaxID=446860 RepID=A0A2N4T054_9MICC|nr:ABC transporter substrate-binding protein [Kocuria flava]PLC11566.1 glycine/betaine ABC transporter substrate-binding protein [Kocuria flava]
MTHAPARRRLALPATAAALLLGLTACGGSGEDPLSGGEQGTGAAQDTVTVGSADFPESQVLAELYAGALDSAGIEAETSPGIGAREAYVTAVQDGSVDVVPDYSGNLLLYADPEATETSAEEIVQALPEALPEGLTVLEPSSAENKDAMVVTPETAERYGLTSIADMAEVCDELVIAGPPEFRERPQGLRGLEEHYGCVPRSFEPINDGGGPLTLQALLDGDVDVADIFTTTPSIADHDLVVLEDPENNFIAQQVLPLAAEGRLSEEAEEALNELSGKLTTEDLVELNRKVSGEQQMSPADAAQEWLSANGY